MTDAELAVFQRNICRCKSTNVNTMVQCCGWILDEALAAEELAIDQYEQSAPIDSKLTKGYVPKPHEIEGITAKIRCGEIVVSAESQKRWRQHTDFTAWQPDCESGFRLAGEIAEDAATEPEWLYSADRLNDSQNCQSETDSCVQSIWGENGENEKIGRQFREFEQSLPRSIGRNRIEI